jgi:hypothetical protein
MSDILSISNNLLSTIYSTSDGASTISSDPLGALKTAEANSAKDIAQEAAQPQVARDIATFRAAVASAKTPEALLQNPTVLKVLLTANGLGDQTAYTALAQKALLSNTSVSTSLADQLPNTAWKAAASTLDFANSGLSVIQNTSVLDTIASGYAEVLWRQSLDTTTPGLSNALTFRSEASTITSVDQILADSSLRSVVLTALGIPETIAYQDIGAQENAISNRLDITQFQNPKFVEEFAQRYLIQNNIANSDNSTSSTNSVLSSYGFASSSTSDSTATDSETLASLVVKSQGLIV